MHNNRVVWSLLWEEGAVMQGGGCWRSYEKWRVGGGVQTSPARCPGSPLPPPDSEMFKAGFRLEAPVQYGQKALS